MRTNWLPLAYALAALAYPLRFGAAQSSPVTGEAPATAPVPVAPTLEANPAVADAADDLETPVTLAMRDAPLLQITRLLSLTTPAAFRFGAPPDLVLSPSLHNEPLLPCLNQLLAPSHWQAQREGDDVFLSPAVRAGGSYDPSWRFWPGAAPPQNWMVPGSTKVALKLGTDASSGTVTSIMPAAEGQAAWSRVP